MEHIISGSETGDILFGRVGLDNDTTIFGYGGDDRIFAYAGNDTIFAGDGDDVVWTGTSKAVVYAGSGNDSIHIGSESTIDGGDGFDWLVDYHAETDPFQTIEIDLLLGLHSIDIADFSTNVVSNIEGYSFTGNWHVHGTGSTVANEFSTDAGNDVLFGLAGNDTIRSGDGNDIVDGGQGADSLYGGDGNDTLIADNEGDVIDGGGGYDTVQISSAGSSGVSLTDWTGVENVLGNDEANLVNAQEYITSIAVDSGQGDDSVIGSDFADTLVGGDGSDTVSGNDGADWIEGGGGGDVIFGDEYSEEEVLALLSMMPRSVDRVDLSHIDQDPKTIGHVVICCYEPAPDWLDAG